MNAWKLRLRMQCARHKGFFPFSPVTSVVGIFLLFSPVGISVNFWRMRLQPLEIHLPAFIFHNKCFFVVFKLHYEKHCEDGWGRMLGGAL